ncbi:MAG: hypothetical protein UEL03_00330, partial [Clostridium sp.]|uniref:hypothetical protein n=1 Tax=Clostridium sp. TaxID=1506 RepID=UPI002E77F2BC
PAAKEVMEAPIASKAAAERTATNLVCFLIINALSFLLFEIFFSKSSLHYQVIILRIWKSIASCKNGRDNVTVHG